MTKCPDCRKYDCECEINPALMPGIVTKTLKDSSNSFEMLMQMQPGRLPSYPEREKMTCPICHGRGGIPDDDLHGDWPCFPCNCTGKILVGERLSTWFTYSF